MAGFSLGTGKKGSWARARATFEKATRDAKKAQLVALRRAALKAERAIKVGLATSSPGGKPLAPLSPITVLLTGRSKPLASGFGTGLAGSVTTTIDERKLQAFVGVHRGARSGDGEDLVNVALIHEFGTGPFAIPVTDGVRRFFWMLHFKSGGAIKPISPTKTVILHPGVPARPFVRPAIESIRDELQAEVRAAVVGTFGGA